MLSMHDTRRCLYCLEPVALPDVTHACDGCGEQLHAACFDLNHGCTTYGCIRCEATPPATTSLTEVAWAGPDRIARDETTSPTIDPELPRASVAIADPPRADRFCGTCGGIVGAANQYCGACGTRLEDPA